MAADVEVKEQSVELCPPCSLNMPALEAHFTPLSSQSNVYGMTSVPVPGGTNKLLLASLRGDVLFVEYPRDSQQPTVSEVHFSYIRPGDAEIVSIDAFSRLPSSGSGLVIAVTLVLLKASCSKQQQFLNIYSSLEVGHEYDINSIAQGCHYIELDFVPFQLSHFEVTVNGEKEIVFLLSGSDCQIHLFREDRYHRRFEEHPVQNFFPELQDIPSNVLWMDIKYSDNNTRVAALGCQSGHVQVTVYDLEKSCVIYKNVIQQDGPISSVKLFAFESEQEPSFSGIQDLLGLTKSPEIGKESTIRKKNYHLLVSCAIEVTVVYLNIEKYGLSELASLPESDRYDSVLCSCVADIDWDGKNEIILGTYGQELLAYKCCTDSSKPNDVEFQLIWKRSFADPLFAIEYIDLSNDGLREIVVSSLSGLHILQHDLEIVSEKCLSRLKELTKTIIDKKDDQFIKEDGAEKDSHESIENTNLAGKCVS